MKTVFTPIEIEPMEALAITQRDRLALQANHPNDPLLTALDRAIAALEAAIQTINS